MVSQDSPSDICSRCIERSCLARRSLQKLATVRKGQTVAFSLLHVWRRFSDCRYHRNWTTTNRQEAIMEFYFLISHNNLRVISNDILVIINLMKQCMRMHLAPPPPLPPRNFADIVNLSEQSILKSTHGWWRKESLNSSIPYPNIATVPGMEINTSGTPKFKIFS